MLKNNTFMMILAGIFATGLSVLKPSLNEQFEVCELNYKDLYWSNWSIYSLADYENGQPIPLDHLEKMSVLDDADVSENMRVCVCTINDAGIKKICGGLLYEIHTDTSSGKVVGIYHVVFVSKHYRRQGVASLMMLHAQKICSQRNASHLLIKVLANNRAAVNCYYNFGFYIPFKRKIFALFEPLWIMEKKI